MPIISRQSSDVRTREIDLSQFIINSATSTAAQVFVSAQGRTGWLKFTNLANFRKEYGTKDASIGFGHYTADNFFSEGNQLWCRRAVGTGFKTAAAVLKDNGSGVTSIAGIVAGVADPDNVAIASLVTNPDIAILEIYANKGPGSYGNSLKVALRSDNLATIATPTTTQAATGGTLIAATYSYKVTVVGKQGEYVPSTASTGIVVSAGTTNVVTVNWTAVAGAIGYKVYGRTGAAFNLIATVGANVLTYADTGAVTPDVAKPGSAVVAPAIATQFILDVYDTTIDANTPAESFPFSVIDQVDDTGTQLEAEQRINPFSSLIKVQNNVAALVSIPVIMSVTTPVALLGGTSGTAPTSSNIITAWGEISDTERYDVNMLINVGITAVSVQQAMNTLAALRADCVAYLDVPPTMQAFQDSVDYRNLTLNINSSYSAIFGPDVLEQDNDNGKALYVPFSGWAAALSARTDKVANPWFSPAGLNRGLVPVLGIRNLYDEGMRNALFNAQVNYARKFIADGIALWEQQTLLTKTSAFQYISIRRLSNVVKTAVKRFLRFSLHEPNDDFTRRLIVNAISDYLSAIKAARGIKVFQVVADDSVNTDTLYNAGILRVVVLIQPVLPVNGIMLDLVMTRAGLTFSEINLAAI